jgi:hypothetical protein
MGIHTGQFSIYGDGEEIWFVEIEASSSESALDQLHSAAQGNSSGASSLVFCDIECSATLAT